MFAVVRPCGIIFSLRELYGTESISQVVCILMALCTVVGRAPKVLGYDDACHLHKFIHLPRRAAKYASNTLWQQLSGIKFFIDRFHMRNHVDKWCIKNMDPEREDILPDMRCRWVRCLPNVRQMGKVNTEICEQTFSWLQGYKNSTRHMGEARFRWFLLTMCWMRNEARVRLIVIRVIVIRVIVIDTIKNQANIVVIKAYLVLNYFHLDFANNYHSAWATRFANCGPKERIRHQPQRRPRQAALYRAGNN